MPKNEELKSEFVAYRKLYKHGTGVVIPLPKLFREALAMNGGVYVRVELDRERRALVIEVAR